MVDGNAVDLDQNGNTARTALKSNCLTEFESVHVTSLNSQLRKVSLNGPQTGLLVVLLGSIWLLRRGLISGTFLESASRAPTSV